MRKEEFETLIRIAADAISRAQDSLDDGQVTGESEFIPNTYVKHQLQLARRFLTHALEDDQ
jgi:hypothetical protein